MNAPDQRSAEPDELLLQWVELIPDGVLVVDGQGLIVRVNGAMTQISGWEAQELVGRTLERLLPPGRNEHHDQRVRKFFANPQLRPMGRVASLALQQRSGDSVPVDISLGVVQLGGRPLALAVVRDVSEMKALHARNDYLAMYDGLTGLYSRSMFTELLQQAVAQSLRCGQPMALLLIDLDDFKSVNDGHGH